MPPEKKKPAPKKHIPRGIELVIPAHVRAVLPEGTPVRQWGLAWAMYEAGLRDELLKRLDSLKIPHAGSATPPPAGSAPPPAAGEPWQPAQPTQPAGQGEPVTEAAAPTVDPMEQYMADGDVPAEGGTGEAQHTAGETDPRFAPIGHYTTEVVGPIVRLAMGMAKDPNVGAQVAREMLEKDEPFNASPTSDMIDGRGIAHKLDQKRCLKGNMGDYAWGEA